MKIIQCGAMGAGMKMAAFGTTVPWTESQEEYIGYAESEYGVDLGRYGSVQRSGGMYSWFTDRGLSLGRNSINQTGDEETGKEEGVHYVQQVKYGPFKFYGQAIKEQWLGDALMGDQVGFDPYNGSNHSQFGNNNTSTGFTLEYEAHVILKLKSLPTW